MCGGCVGCMAWGIGVMLECCFHCVCVCWRVYRGRVGVGWGHGMPSNHDAPDGGFWSPKDKNLLMWNCLNSVFLLTVTMSHDSTATACGAHFDPHLDTVLIFSCYFSMKQLTPFLHQSEFTPLCPTACHSQLQSCLPVSLLSEFHPPSWENRRKELLAKEMRREGVRERVERGLFRWREKRVCSFEREHCVLLPHCYSSISVI